MFLRNLRNFLPKSKKTQKLKTCRTSQSFVILGSFLQWRWQWASIGHCVLVLTILDNFDNFWNFLRVLTILTIFDNVDDFWQFWPFSTILTISDNFWPFWQFSTILTIFETFDKILTKFDNSDHFYNVNIFYNWRQLTTIQTIAFAILTIEKTILETCDI